MRFHYVSPICLVSTNTTVIRTCRSQPRVTEKCRAMRAETDQHCLLEMAQSLDANYSSDYSVMISITWENKQTSMTTLHLGTDEVSMGQGKEGKQKRQQKTKIVKWLSSVSTKRTRQVIQSFKSLYSTSQQSWMCSAEMKQRFVIPYEHFAHDPDIRSRGWGRWSSVHFPA